MKIVIAPDSFKESLSAAEVCAAIEQGLRRVMRRGLQCRSVPLADGGEGTAEALVAATGGRMHRVRVQDPLQRPVRAAFGMLGDGRTAVVEMATASGLPLLAPGERNPLRTSTYGTGELIRAALDRGARRIIVGLGGSATNDGGAGMAMALGARFLDARGRPLRAVRSGGNLDRVAAVDLSGLDPRLAAAEVVVACDVDNPLCGPNGASAIFGPQKGASPARVRRLDENLRHLGGLLEAASGRAVVDVAGAGAAGGLGAGLLAVADARLRPGIDIVMEAVDLPAALAGADLVITGEGRLDSQTVAGKTAAGVARAARRARVPVAEIGGGLSTDAVILFEHGILAIEAAVCRPQTLEAAMQDAASGVSDAAERLFRAIRLGQKMPAN